MDIRPKKAQTKNRGMMGTPKNMAGLVSPLYIASVCILNISYQKISDSCSRSYENGAYDDRGTFPDSLAAE